MMIGLRALVDTDDRMKKPLVTARKADIVVAALETQIVDGTRGPGKRLDERELAEEFGVSRTPIREAFRQLASIGLVEDLGRRGVLVAKHSASDMLDSFLVVAELEGIAAGLAAQRISVDVLRNAQDANALCREAASTLDITAFNSANMDFHNAIIKGSKNRLLQDQLSTARPITFPFRHHVSTLPGYMEKSVEEHIGVLTALSTGDADRAQELMCNHVNLQGEQVLGLLRLLEKSG
ncbi:MAG: DNA-binding GntR family transcriptional regulator [Ascidiaceihabitans sp.]|jgi:DNA-binding GntR family transcriptional regulator|tara:strand:+ start:5479 stop:6189 length:711 start_codon:yes stop_codon:yes gene_type:complete